MVRPVSRRASGSILLAALLLAAAGTARPARAEGLSAAEEAGVWDLSFEKGNRRCRLTLRRETGPAGHVLAMPAGCHRALPILAAATAWASRPGNRIQFLSAAGEIVLDLSPDGGPSLSATVGEAGDVYVLAPVDLAVQAALVEQGAPPAGEAPASREAVTDRAPGGGVLVDSSTPVATTAAPAPATFPPATAAEVAGHYAVVRQDRDTGCMVTLDQGVAARADLKARLAPACRDQGIVIFDPVGWQLSKGELILTARKGHKAVLGRVGTATWSTKPLKGVALVLKRL